MVAIFYFYRSTTLKYQISRFAGVVARVKSLRGRMGESTRQVDGLFESLLAQSFDNCFLTI